MSTPLTPFLQLLKMGIIIPTTRAVNQTTQDTFWHRIDTHPMPFHFPFLDLVSCPHLTSGPCITIASQRSPLSHSHQPGPWIRLSSPFLLTQPPLLPLLPDVVDLIK